MKPNKGTDANKVRSNKIQGAELKIQKLKHLASKMKWMDAFNKKNKTE